MQTQWPPLLQEATQSLIENLAASEPFARYQQAQTRMDADPEACDLLKQLSRRRPGFGRDSPMAV